MMLRSFLFIPGDSEKKLAKGDASGADALILDLEDSVAPARKQAAREMTAAYLQARPRNRRSMQLWVRVNALETEAALADLAAVGAGADGVVLPKARGPEDVAQLGRRLDEAEADAGLARQTIKILPVATETPAAVFRLGDYAQAKLERLYGLTWGAEDLSAALGASTNIDANAGGWAFTYRLARSLTLLAAHAAGVAAIETLHADFQDEAGLRASSGAARAEGFSGRLAIHPAQVAVINECFTPSASEVAQAERIAAAFAAAPEAGVVALDGRMLDRPHLSRAQHILALAAAHRPKPT
ncbi:MAG TPA: CoA ester lyase [Caulobacterales bacterium]|nr:CoA ester lyase [Caulobacterales bacterium]